MSREKTDFGVTAAIKQQRRLCQILGRADFVAALTMEAVGLAEEDELRDSEAMDKVRETGGIMMIIGEILCLFAYIS